MDFDSSELFLIGKWPRDSGIDPKIIGNNLFLRSNNFLKRVNLDENISAENLKAKMVRHDYLPKFSNGWIDYYDGENSKTFCPIFKISTDSGLFKTDLQNLLDL